MSKLRAYISSSMTGRSGTDLVKQAALIQNLGRHYGVEILDPIVEEGVEESHVLLANNLDTLRKFFSRDKEMIRKAHILIDITADRKSFGTEYEIGYARYHLHRPCIRVHPNLAHSVAVIESDVICRDVETAFRTAVMLFGSPFQRLLWAIHIAKHSWWRLILVRLSIFWWWI